MPQRLGKVPALPPRPRVGHKGLFGRVLVVGGCDGMIGAPALAGLAALRLGAGLVELAAPASILQACLTLCPELIGLPLTASNHAQLIEQANKADALVIGPGLGTRAPARARLMRLLKVNKPKVLDADALNLLAAGGLDAARQWAGRAILTPHPGEMQRLIQALNWGNQVPKDDPGRRDLALRLSRTLGQVIVLKGHRTVIAESERYFINSTGDSSLSKAGTGDVLSGMIGCLLAQGMDPFAAAILGVNLHGKAGEAAGRRLGRRSVLARDVVEALLLILAEKRGL